MAASSNMTFALIGPWYPAEGSSQALLVAANRRRSLSQNYDGFEHLLLQTNSTNLSHQEGHTAALGQEAFDKGAKQARNVSDKNVVKQTAYGRSAAAVEGLRSELRGIAARGNTQIDEIKRSKAKFDKIAAIMQVIHQANIDAARASESFSNDIRAAISEVLSADGDSRSIEQFAKDQNVELGVMAPKPVAEDQLRQQVTQMLDSRSETEHGGTNSWSNNLRNAGDDSPNLSVEKTSNSISSDFTLNAGADSSSTPTVSGESGVVSGTSSSATLNAAQSNPGATSSQVTPGTQGVSVAPVPQGGGLQPTAGGVGNLNGGASATGTNTSIPSTSGLSPSTPSAPLSPESLSESFNSGMQSGAPMSAGAEALSQSISETAQQAPQNPTPPAPVAPTAPSGGFAYEAPQHFSEPAAPAPAPTETTQQPMYAAPVAAAPAAPVAPMAPPPAATAGPLPAYGSDLRPAAAAAAPPPAAAPAPLSAPTSAASGTAASNQPSVVRQAPTAATPTGVTPAGIAETAMGSAATGAIAGAAAQQSIEQARLDRLLEAVARQEPKLKWAIGDREDGTTVLVTDLASGWIPPHIEIPKGVELLQPQKRRGGLEHLLGETVNHSIWTPGHYLPNAKDVEPVEMTFRARQVPDIDELNWELTQATNWRDGLPRLAHTLTKAGIAGTGVLESEADLLYEHLTAARDKVVRAYPDNVDPTDVGNWQLLASISGLIAKDKTTLRYHFAWFQALSMATQGGSR